MALRNLRRAGAAAVVAALALAGCQGPGEPEPFRLGESVEPEAAVRLGDARLAFYLSPQYTSLAEGHDEAFVVLAGADGSTRAIRTTGMDGGRLAWTGEGLFFADAERDYLLDESGLSATPSAKPDGQVSLHQVGDAVVGLYNEGFTEDGGYREHVVEHRDGASASRPVEGAFWTVARCEDAVYGWTRAMGPALEEYPAGADGGAPALLTRLWPGDAEVVATAPVAADAPDDTASDAPCADGVVHVLTAVPYGEADADGVRPPRTVLRSWDTGSGERTDHELVDTAGEPLGLMVDDMLFAQYDGASVAGGELRWLGADGTVRATELGSGRTRELFAAADPGGDQVVAERRAVFARDAMFVLEIPRDPAGDLVLVRHAGDDGAREELLRVAGVAGELGVDMVLRGVALPPELTGEEPRR
ncbi:hypothetical protein GCM10027059_47230 [Myceligenerans halotolerans]